ncbi:MAG: hypothetical protein ACRD29_10380 [Acidimicrobiales bacterium]
MLGKCTYDQDYIDGCRSRIAADMAAYASAGVTETGFESALFNDLAIVLDAYFTHRLRVVEGKDGNPLDEVRLIAASLIPTRVACSRTTRSGSTRRRASPDSHRAMRFSSTRRRSTGWPTPTSPRSRSGSGDGDEAEGAVGGTACDPPTADRPNEPIGHSQWRRAADDQLRILPPLRC